MISFLQNTLYIGKKHFDFSYVISQIKIFEQCVLVRLDIPVNVIENRNIFAINMSCEILWQIKDVEFFNQTLKDCPYSGIEAIDNEFALLINWCDTNVVVNAQSGDILKVYQTK